VKDKDIDVQKLIERSSLGTRSARSARRSVSPETGRRIAQAAASGRYLANNPSPSSRRDRIQG
jgi:hypothetical protein